MRRSLIRRASAIKAGPSEKDLAGRMEWWVREYGPSAAAWLVSRVRRSIHRTGKVDFDVPVDLPTPPAMRVALEALRRRPGSWRVEELRRVSYGMVQRVHRVVWVRWQTNGVHRGR